MLQNPLAVLVFLKQVTVVEFIDNGPELGFGIAAELAEITHAQRVQLAVALFDHRDRFLAGHLAVADVAGGVIGGGGMAELGIFQPAVYQVGAAVDLVKVFVLHVHFEKLL